MLLLIDSVRPFSWWSGALSETTYEKANFVSKHPNKQLLTNGLLFKPHITLQLVSVSPADVSQENPPPQRPRELSAFTAHLASSQGGASALARHVAGMPENNTDFWKHGSHSTDKIRLPMEPVGD